MKRTKVAIAPLAAGQIWELDDSTIEITLVGRTLIHYKKAPHGVKRVPSLLLNKDAMEKYLRDNRAVLLTAAQNSRQTKLRVSTNGVRP